jgi:hypothetical protein
MASSAPTLRSFNLALVQLGQVGSDKTKNLAHAREQILKAASREDGIKPQLIVLPVGIGIFFVQTGTLKIVGGDNRSVLILPMGLPISLRTRRQLGTGPGAL